MRSLAWDLWLGIFGLDSLAWDLWFGIFDLGSLVWDLWLWIFGLGSLAWDLWLGISAWVCEVGRTRLVHRGKQASMTLLYTGRSALMHLWSEDLHT